ncbi:MAG TPA: biotin carboxylase N-terminal domain-containing protein [Thermomicrobiaceae bacterium]|nr:biotin carboxylase N-terminal domain-containing protein [Thermomicrobiaceae bacterium]
MSERRIIAIANRGEVAIRIAATCRLRGYAPVLLIAEPDAGGLAARRIGRVEMLGPSTSEMDPERVVTAAMRAGATFLHPGYGFLSERPSLAEACERAGIVFLGPTPETLAICGDKIETRRIAEKVGVPVMPASTSLNDDSTTWLEEAVTVGFPLLVKAAGGGGGASLRRVNQPDELIEAVESSRREAQAAGAGSVLYLERFLERPRHIEVQVAGDGSRAIAIGDRDCSLQRRHQKVIEEAPAPNLPEESRRRLHRYAVTIAEAVKLRSLATVEFLYGSDGTIAFLEVNPRLQVEHPVTEATSGIDLVSLQIDIAEGKGLGSAEPVPAPTGHAIECRLYAEDPRNHFLPSPGRIEVLDLPYLPRLRVDPSYAAGDRIPASYDPLIAKLISWGSDREAAIRLLDDGLRQTAVAGVATNRPWLLRLLELPEFHDARHHTGTTELAGVQSQAPSELALATLIATSLDRPPSTDPWQALGPFRMSGAAEIAFQGLEGDWEEVVTVEPAADGAWPVHPVGPDGGKPKRLRWLRDERGVWSVQFGGDSGLVAVARRPDGSIEVSDTAGRWLARPRRRALEAERKAAQNSGIIRAPLPGKILRVPVEVGQAIDDNQPLVIMSAMKIEFVLRAPISGVVRQISCAADQQVDAGDLLVEVAPAEGAGS